MVGNPARLTGMLADHLREADVVAISAPNRLALHFPAAYTFSKSFCERPEHLGKLERALAEVAGQPVRLEFVLAEPSAATEPRRPPWCVARASPNERLQEKAETSAGATGDGAICGPTGAGR